MAVVAAYSNASNGVTATGLQDFPGHRLLIALFDRSGGETASIDTSDDDLDAAVVQVGAEVTDPTNGSNRRSLFLFEAIIPATVGNNPIITPTVLDGSASPVEASIVAAVVEAGASYSLAEVVSANSAGATVTSQATGTTASVAAGDVLVIAAETTRGATTHAWALTDSTPPNPGGGDWDLSITSGTGASQRRGGVGYYTEAAAASQTWADTVSYGTARMASALIAVWTTGAGGGEEHQGDGGPCSVTLTPGAGSGAPALVGSGAGCSTMLTPAAGQGSPVTTGDGQAATATLTPGAGAGAPSVVAAGQQVQVVLTPAVGNGEASGSGTGDGRPAAVVLTPGAGAGSPALVGPGLACSVVLTPGSGQPQATIGTVTAAAARVATVTLAPPRTPSAAGAAPAIPTAGGVS